MSTSTPSRIASLAAGAMTALFVMAFLIPTASSTPVPGEYERLVSVKLVSDAPNSPRMKREIGSSNLPTQLHFAVPVDDEHVMLVLLQTEMLPLATSEGDVPDTELEDVGVYTDAAKGANLIVKKKDGHYYLKGIFVHNDTEWSLEPLVRRKRDVDEGHDHRLVPAHARLDGMNFEGDTILVDDLPTKVQYKRSVREVVNPLAYRLLGLGDKAMGTRHYIELVFVVDYADYKKWLDFVGEWAVLEMHVYYTLVAAMIKSRYMSIDDSEMAIRVLVKKLVIVTDPNDLLADTKFMEVGSGGVGYVIEFVNWYKEPKNKIPKADHYMLFTGLKIGKNGQQAGGFAPSNTFCSIFSLSVTTNHFDFQTAVIAAHELGHSLGSDHDGDIPGCHKKDGFIMTPYLSQHRSSYVKFSRCSIKSIKATLARSKCTLRENTDLPNHEYLGGEHLYMNRDQQCQLHLRNKKARTCGPKDDLLYGDRSCTHLYCIKPGSKCSITGIPFDNTECGEYFGYKYQFCRAGKCIFSKF